MINLPVLYSFGTVMARAVLNKDNIKPQWVIQQKCSKFWEEVLGRGFKVLGRGKNFISQTSKAR